MTSSGHVSPLFFRFFDAARCGTKLTDRPDVLDSLEIGAPFPQVTMSGPPHQNRSFATPPGNHQSKFPAERDDQLRDKSGPGDTQGFKDRGDCLLSHRRSDGDVGLMNQAKEKLDLPSECSDTIGIGVERPQFRTFAKPQASAT
jgi:hypothetical protein